MTVDPLVRSWLRESNWAATTRESGRRYIAPYLVWLTDHDLTLQTVTKADCQDFLDELTARGLAPNTVRMYWRMMRFFHRWLAAEGETDRDPMRTIVGPKVFETPVRVLTDREYRKLVDTCDRRTEYGRRDEAILSLLWWAGLRRAELVGLDIEGVDLDGRVLTIGSRTFTTKTGTVRRVPLAAETVAALDRYLRRRGDDPGPLFLSEHGDTPDGRRLRPNAIYLMLCRRGARALGRRVGAHEFRRAMATRTKRAGASDGTLMAIAGWKDGRMIGRYTRMHAEELAHDEFHRLVDTSVTTTRRRGRRIAG